MEIEKLLNDLETWKEEGEDRALFVLAVEPEKTKKDNNGKYLIHFGIQGKPKTLLFNLARVISENPSVLSLVETAVKIAKSAIANNKKED